MRVLLVEDDRMIGEAVESSLKQTAAPQTGCVMACRRSLL